MLIYRAAFYQPPDDAMIVAKVLDFPGVITQGRTLEMARKMLRDALSLMAEVILDQGEPLPRPDPTVSDSDATLVEPIYLKPLVLAGGKT